MNTKFLKDKNFIDTIKNCIFNAKKDASNITDRHRVWEYVKCRIRSESISYSLIISKENKRLEKDLIDRITILENKLDSSPDIDTLEEFRLVKQELEFIYNEKAKGSIIRSRCQWIDENEKCSKFFLNQEINNYNTKHIKSLNVDNRLITIPEEILDSERKFYKKLYTDLDPMQLMKWQNICVR